MLGAPSRSSGRSRANRWARSLRPRPVSSPGEADQTTLTTHLLPGQIPDLALTSSWKDLRTHADTESDRMRLLVTIEAEPGERVRPPSDPARHRARLHPRDPGVRPGDGADREPSRPSRPTSSPCPARSSVPTLVGPVDLYLGEQMLDATLRIDESPIRHGVVLGLGQPSCQRTRSPRDWSRSGSPPDPVRATCTGSGIGRATLGPGRHAPSGSPSSPTSRGSPDLDEVLVLDVATDGTVTRDPRRQHVLDLEMEVPLRREPVTAPIVLEASSVAEEKRRRWLRRSKTVLEFQLGERVDPGAAVPLVHLDRRAAHRPDPVGARPEPRRRSRAARPGAPSPSPTRR